MGTVLFVRMVPGSIVYVPERSALMLPGDHKGLLAGGRGGQLFLWVKPEELAWGEHQHPMPLVGRNVDHHLVDGLH